MLTWRLAVALGVLPWALAACGSDPSNQPGEDSTPATPDYTQSPCYGDSRTTSVYDADTHGTREITATCRAEGEHTLVYVADEIWEISVARGVPAMTQAEVDGFMIGYELDGSATSFQPDVGVLPTDEFVFGDLPLEKLPIFVVDSGGAGEGYLCSWCAGLEFHLDGPLLRSLQSDKALSIAAHETVHVIHRGLDPDETIWVDETLAQAAMTVNGFFTDGDWLDDFLQDTNVAWGPSVNDPLQYHYGAGLLLGSYLWERGGTRLLRAITAEPLDDWAGIDAALATTGEAGDSWQLYLDMALATFLDDPASGYSFESLDLEGGVVPVSVATGSTLSDTIQPYGLVFVVFDSDANSVTLEAGAGVSSRLVRGGAPAQVHELVRGDAFDLESTPRVLLLTAPAAASYSLTVR